LGTRTVASAVAVVVAWTPDVLVMVVVARSEVESVEEREERDERKQRTSRGGRRVRRRLDH
jgi:hypothetical protein